ncbi:hypothetical protein Gotri_001496 [Gossypium trilobum]|uniref:DnaJ/Hsp40 cysteine-rich domain superfamily protein n=1 Tax=Gossypium trilobum TaxID=34281 RepID=A0A7J9FEW2_9ROSI|nr:hypothetical protein [Gossypium trilobum]
MELALNISSPLIFPTNSTPKLKKTNKISYGFGSNGPYPISKICAVCSNGSVSSSSSSHGVHRKSLSGCFLVVALISDTVKIIVLLGCLNIAEARAVGDAHRRRSSLESLFCYDKPIPEERIEEPVGVSLAEKLVGDNPRCTDCQAKGAVLCTTCSGSGLYVDSILESQGIIVKVRCLEKRLMILDSNPKNLLDITS